MNLKSTFLLIFIVGSLKLAGQEKLFGHYRSNVADLGFFVTEIQLNNDYTFDYKFSGDLVHQKKSGTFKLIDNQIIQLTFNKKNETKDTISDVYSSGNIEILDKKYLYKNGKLFSFHIDGNVVKRGQAYSRFPKYLFWGDRYIKKSKMYLKRINK